LPAELAELEESIGQHGHRQQEPEQLAEVLRQRIRAGRAQPARERRFFLSLVL